MKKYLIIAASMLFMMGCTETQTTSEEKDKEQVAQTEQTADDAELAEMHALVNEIQETFKAINEAEGRIAVANSGVEAPSDRERMREDLRFIQEKMRENRDLIEQLQKRLQTSTGQTSALKSTVERLMTQLSEQNNYVQKLEAQLAAKDSTIAMQSEQIDILTENVSNLAQENAQQQQAIQAQDKDLHTAWYAVGTKSELKEMKILVKGQVLKTSDFQKDYFRKIDIRIDREIKLESKSAELLTTHPDGSYQLNKNSEGKYILVINDPEKFWSASRYLVVQVK